MAHSGKSPNKFIGSIASAAAGASGGGSQAFNALAGRSGLLGKLAKVAQPKRLVRNGVLVNPATTTNVPSVVATAGASGMSGRIEGIESRLESLENNSSTAGAAQPAAVSPSETFTEPLTGMEINRGATGDSFDSEQSKAMAQARIAERAMLSDTPMPQTPASEQLGSLMASPFTMRQRSNMGPLKLKK